MSMGRKRVPKKPRYQETKTVAKAKRGLPGAAKKRTSQAVRPASTANSIAASTTHVGAGDAMLSRTRGSRQRKTWPFLGDLAQRRSLFFFFFLFCSFFFWFFFVFFFFFFLHIFVCIFQGVFGAAL